MADTTVPALASDAEPTGLRLSCRLGWHTWSAWGVPQNYEYGVTFRQARTCLCCGRAQLRKFSVYNSH